MNEIYMREKQLIEDAAAVAEIHNKNLFEGDNNPDTTANLCIKELGLTRAKEIIAVFCNIAAYFNDGRVGDYSREWAKTVTGTGLNGVPDGLGESFDRIHPAHLDQLASAVRENERERIKRSEVER